jgi:hypothetical protein
MKDSEIAEKLSALCGVKVTINAVRKMRQKLGVKKLQGRGKVGVVGSHLNPQQTDTVLTPDDIITITGGQ